MLRKLFRFHGGLHLDDHKAELMHEAIQPLPIPGTLVIPTQQHIGHAAEPVVEVGEKVLKGQVIARATDYISVPIHASSSGTVTAITEHDIPHPSGMQGECIVIETDGEDNWIECKPVDDYQQLDPSALRNIIREAGIVGLGGAGFPSFIKLNPGPSKSVDTLIINGAECEPYITCDAMLMQEQPRRIIEGALIMKHALHARKCIIAVEDNKAAAHTVLVNALQEHEADELEIIHVPTLYPTGGEKQLIYVVTGNEVPSHGLPIDISVVCHNVATAAAVNDAIHEGKPLIERVITVTGDGISTRRNYHVPVGTSFKEVLRASGYKAEQQTQNKIIMGGPMMGFDLAHADIPVVKTTNCILVQHNKPTQPAMPCIRCGECATVCPAQLLPQQLYWYSRSNNFDKVQDYNLFDCIECGCCAFVCPSHIPLVQYYRYAKTEIWQQERDKHKADIARERHEFRLFRIERKKQEDEERKRRKKELLKKASSDEAEQPGTQVNAQIDAKKAAIEAAMARVKARREEQENQRKNTDNLTEDQRKKIDEIEQRRQQSSKDE